jgi:hypothetical protein
VVSVQIALLNMDMMNVIKLLMHRRKKMEKTELRELVKLKDIIEDLEETK